MSFDWKSLVSSVAPTLATALGSHLAGAAVSAISIAITGSPNASESEIAAKLQGASPETLLALKKADQDFQTKMAELGVDLEKIAAGDRDSAREMQKTTRSKIVPILASLTVAGFFGVVAWVLSGKVSLESTLLGFVLGQVSAKAEQVYNYYFGSSAGSKEKTEHIATMRSGK